MVYGLVVSLNSIADDTEIGTLC